MKECHACHRCFSDDYNNCPDDGNQLLVSLRGTPLLEGRYQLERRLGDGGMGIVYKAHHSYLKTIHAIKVILPDLVGHDPMFGTRFRQEAMIAASIRHPNIVLVTDFGIAQDILPFLVMEFIKGRSLQDVFTKKGTLPPEISLQILTAIGAGVGAAHRQGIIHRDLKPLNIMLQDDRPINEAVKILDFGLAKIRSGEMFGSFVQAKTTGLMGSPLYMAPEQWSDHELDSRADIYSLGIILYQMLAGDVPFKGSSMPTIMRGHLMSEPPRFSELGVRVPTPIEEVVRRALAKDPNDRPATVEDFISELREATVRIELTRRTESAFSQKKTLSLTPTAEKTAASIDIGWSPPSSDSSPQTLTETSTTIQEEADRLAREFEEAQRRAEEARERAEQAAHRRAEEEAARKLAEEEAERKRAREAELRQREEEEARRRTALEAARKLIEEEEARKAVADEKRREAEEEAARLRAKEDAERLAREIGVLQLRAEEARRQAEEEARKRSEEVVARKLAEEKAERLTREVEEAQRRAEDARKRVEEEARMRAEEETQRKDNEEEKTRRRAEEEALRFAEVEAARLLAKEEADRLAREVEEAQRRAEEARLRTEEEARKRIEEEAARKRAEGEAKRLAGEVEEARKRVEEERQRKIEEEALLLRAKEDDARKHIEEELQKRSEEVARKWAEEEASRRLAEEEAARKRAEEQALRFAEQEAARKRAEDEANRLALKIEEAEHRAKEALLKVEQEARSRAADEERRRTEEEATRLRAKEDADRLAREVEAAQLRAEEARMQAQEEARKRSEEATARKLAEEKAESLEREVREAQGRAEEARKRVEEEGHRQAEQEERRRQQEEALRAGEIEERRKLLEEIQLLEQEKRRRAEAMRVAELENLALAERRRQDELARETASQLSQEQPTTSPQITLTENQNILHRQSQPGAIDDRAKTGGDLLARKTRAIPDDQIPRRSLALRVLPWIAITILVLAGAGYGVYRLTIPTPVSNVGEQAEVADLVLIPAGTFLMGRNEPSDPNQYPAHSTTVREFYMDRTEVTSAEYSQFVRAEKYEPPGDWKGDNPPKGQELWPVGNVSQEDAIAFARWRSKRDNVKYRLPTEEEWEYAARGGSQNYLYPWGNNWFDDRANLGTGAGREVDFAKPVGSYPQGASNSGVLDLIGNVWEWTSSEASIYSGNTTTQLPARERGWIVVRGGSHQSLHANAVSERGSREFPATSRQWFPKDTKANTLGFRLVRSGS